MFDTLRLVPLFSHLSDEDLVRLSEGVTRVELASKQVLFSEGVAGDRAYVIEAGELEIIKRSSGREVLLAVRGPGEVIGEMALLEEAPRMASARARTPTTVLAIDKGIIDELISTSASAASAMFVTILERFRSTEARLRQSERMAQLGTLTAGVAHELNNPAAGVRRAAEQLAASVVARTAASDELAGSLTEQERSHIDELLASTPPTSAMSSLDRADREEATEELLESYGIDMAWTLGPALVAAGVSDDVLRTGAAMFGERFGEVLRLIESELSVRSLLHEIETGTGRISDIVGALKSYSYLDQAPVQNVDVTAGIEDTLLILKSKLDGIAVVREYQDGLPHIEAYGSELNQVWTNLIDNAADAINEAEGGGRTISISADVVDESIVVAIADDGVGIPSDIQHRVFDSFFTTKEPGKGTGLGLDISHGIVTERHGGELSVTSVPGRTVFVVTLPMGRSIEVANDGESAP